MYNRRLLRTFSDCEGQDRIMQNNFGHLPLLSSYARKVINLIVFKSSCILGIVSIILHPQFHTATIINVPQRTAVHLPLGQDSNDCT